MIKSFLKRLDRFSRFGAKVPGQAVAAPVAFPTTSDGLVASLNGAGAWTAIWDCQETTGSLVDEIGARALAKGTAAAVYDFEGPTDDKRSVGFSTVTTRFKYDFASGEVGQSDWALLLTLYLPQWIANRAIASPSTYADGTGWKHPVLLYTSGASDFQTIHYNDAGTGNETLTSASYPLHAWHDCLLVYNRNTGLRVYSSWAAVQTDVTPFVGTWPDWNGSFVLTLGSSATWGTSCIDGMRIAYAAFTLDETAVDDLYANGDTRLTTFRALRTAPKFPNTPGGLATSIGYGSSSWLALALFNEASGNAYDDRMRVLTATGVSGDDSIAYRQAGPTASKYAVTLQDTGAGAGTAARFTYANGTLHPAASSFAALCVFKVEASDTTTRTLFGITTGGAYWRVRCSGTTGLLTFQIFDGTLSNTLTGSVDHHNQWVTCLIIFDQGTDTLYMTTPLEDVSISGVSIGSISNAGVPLAIGSTDCHKSTDFAYFAYTATITDLVANRTTIVSNFEANAGM